MLLNTSRDKNLVKKEHNFLYMFIFTRTLHKIYLICIKDLLYCLHLILIHKCYTKETKLLFNLSFNMFQNSLSDQVLTLSHWKVVSGILLEYHSISFFYLKFSIVLKASNLQARYIFQLLLG